jgi:hypothetical protein
MFSRLAETCSEFHFGALRLAVAIARAPLHSGAMFPLGRRAQLLDVCHPSRRDRLTDEAA